MNGLARSLIPFVPLLTLGGSLATAATHSRNDFEGAWKNNRGVTIVITQFGSTSATITDQALGRNYQAEFGVSSPIPTSYVSSGKGASDAIRGGTYRINLTRSPDKSVASGTIDGDIAIPLAGSYYEFAVTGLVRAAVPAKGKFPAECPGAFRPRSLECSITSLQLKDKAQARNPALIDAIKRYLATLGARLALNHVAYSDTFVEQDPDPSRTAAANAKCARKIASQEKTR
jgi:hypothetical protein